MKRRAGIRCPTCGVGRMLRVLREVTTTAGRKTLSVPDVEVDECPRCGERLYDLQALQRIRQVRDSRAA